MRSPEELRSAFGSVETDRLSLRAAQAGDADAAFAIHGNPDTYEFHPPGVARSHEESAARLADWTREWAQTGFGFWAIRHREDPQVIGFGGLSLQSWRERPVLNTYYRFDPGVWGRGYATEMVAAALALARRLMPDVAVIVRTRPENDAARAVAEKVGLLRAPQLDDQLLTYLSSWPDAAPENGRR